MSAAKDMGGGIVSQKTCRDCGKTGLNIDFVRVGSGFWCCLECWVKRKESVKKEGVKKVHG